jgi:hypothetical protein
LPEKRGVIVGIGDFIRDKQSEGMSNEAILALVKAQFPGARTTINSIRWYRTNPKNAEGAVSDAQNHVKQTVSRKYPLPPFLNGVITQEAYDRWLSRKSITHVRRDKKRGNTTAINEAYKKNIHMAVVNSRGHDEYTGEALHWHLVSKYNNDESKESRRKYKALFALLPTVDHVGDGLGAADFKICSWRTNDAKADLAHAEFVDLCRRVISHFERPPIL